MLLGAKIAVHTSHNNLTFDHIMTQRVLRWRCYLEECSPTIKYSEGPLNIIADIILQIGCKEDPHINIVQKSTNNGDVRITIKYKTLYSIMDNPDIA